MEGQKWGQKKLKSQKGNYRQKPRKREKRDRAFMDLSGPFTYHRKFQNYIDKCATIQICLPAH